MSPTPACQAKATRPSFETRLDNARVSKTELNHLVMDYLINHGYPMAARKFAHEADLPCPANEEDIASRSAIRDAIHQGKIKQAIELINELDPQLLDQDSSLHFALLRLHLIELIRHATSTDDGDITPVLDFAAKYLAPVAPQQPSFLADLERTMALLIFPSNTLTPQLAEILDPSLRRDVACRVNAALLKNAGQSPQAALHKLVSHRAWAQQKAESICGNGKGKGKGTEYPNAKDLTLDLGQDVQMTSVETADQEKT